MFFSHRDAILKNFYNVNEVEMPDTLTMVEAARFIIVMNDGREYWFDGFTCGYSGQGCGGTEDVLSDLGILEKEYPVNPIISSSRMLHFGEIMVHGNTLVLNQLLRNTIWILFRNEIY